MTTKKTIQTTFHINKKGNITGLKHQQTKKIIIIKTKKHYKPKKCRWCNTTYIPNSSHNLYCSTTCSTLAKQKYGRDRITRFRRKYKDVLKNFTRYLPLGTGGLGEHPSPNFEEEQEKIQRELKIIGIR